MKIEIQNEASNYVIQSYDTDGIKVNDEIITRSFILRENKLIKNWPVADIADLQFSDLSDICDQAPEVIILGSGKQMYFPAQEILSAVYKKNIGLEVMDTYAACRCYNILLSEGRDVIAALILE